MIHSKAGGIDNNHEYIRTVDQIVSGDKGGMIISPRIGLDEDVLPLDYDNVKSLSTYDKKKYKETILDAAETVLGFSLVLIDLLTAVIQEK